MTNPFTDTQGAFTCLFLDIIKLNGEEHKASVFPIEDIDPFTEYEKDSKIVRVSILVMKDEVEVRPEDGDEVIYDGNYYKVSDVKVEQDWYRLTARSAN